MTLMPAPSTPSLGHWRRYLMESMRAWMAEHEADPEKAGEACLPRIRGEFLAAFPEKEREAQRIFDGR